MYNNKSHMRVKLKPDKPEYWESAINQQIGLASFDPEIKKEFKDYKFDLLWYIENIQNNELNDEQKDLLIKILSNIASCKLVMVTPPARGGIPQFIRLEK